MMDKCEAIQDYNKLDGDITCNVVELENLTDVLHMFVYDAKKVVSRKL